MERKNLTDRELEKVVAGDDTESLRFQGKEVPLPDARYKHLDEGGYDGGVNPKKPESISID